jgi:hypothetical protein
MNNLQTMMASEQGQWAQIAGHEIHIVFSSLKKMSISFYGNLFRVWLQIAVSRAISRRIAAAARAMFMNLVPGNKLVVIIQHHAVVFYRGMRKDAGVNNPLDSKRIIGSKVYPE